MLFWIWPLLIAGVVAFLLLRALRAKAGDGLSAVASDIAVYRDQLKEVDRDLARGVLSETEAEAVRIEVSRRLLDADKRARSGAVQSDGVPWVLTAAVILGVMVGSFWLYATLGAPGVRDLPTAERLANLQAIADTRPGQDEAEVAARPHLPPPADPEPAFQELMERLRAALEERPNDTQGLALLAENEARLGNFTAARQAQERLIAAYGDAAPVEERVALLEIMVFAAGGFVSPEAEAVLVSILDHAPETEAARYYAGLLFAQSGRPDRTFPIWRRLLETSPPDAPWVPVIRADIVQLAAAAGVDYILPAPSGPSAEDIEAASEMTVEERQEMIRGMVEGLSERLATEGGPPEDWARLITALGVLGETTRARAIADEARQVFSDSPKALTTVNSARARAGIDG